MFTLVLCGYRLLSKYQNFTIKASDGQEFSIYRVFQKSSPLKLFGIFSLLLSLFFVKFCKFVGSYPHISTNFCRFILIFHQMALIFSTTSHRFHPVKFWVGLFTKKWKMQLFGNFSSSRVLVSDDCKRSITVWFLLLTFYWQ